MWTLYTDWSLSTLSLCLESPVFIFSLPWAFVTAVAPVAIFLCVAPGGVVVSAGAGVVDGAVVGEGEMTGDVGDLAGDGETVWEKTYSAKDKNWPFEELLLVSVN